MKKLIFSFSLLTTISLGAFAQEPHDPCSKYHTHYDQTYCMAKLFIESDNELNHVYKELHTHLKGPLKKQLVEVQRAWIKYRDQACSNGGTIDVNCNYTVNHHRAEYLRDRLRECKTGNCQPKMIRRKNWE